MRPLSHPSLTGLIVAAAGLFSTTCTDESSRATEAPTVRGARLYAETCALCHGANGEGYKADDAPRLAGQEFLAGASDSFLQTAILKGRPGTTMSAWSHERGGPFSDEDAKAVVAFLRTWQAVPAHPLSNDPITGGDPTRGAATYEARCRECHGEKGENGRYIQLANPVFLASANDAYIRLAIEQGRPQTPMPAFSATETKSGVDDLVALLRSWQRPVDGPETLPPEAGGLVDVVLNPGGPEPAWDPKGQFVPADHVKEALDQGATFVLADARPPSDYSGGHIAGAISVPFFKVEPYLPEIPKDRFVITYCACPHAESGFAAEIFRKRGYSRVAVLDEGFKVWRTRGYPVKSGGQP